MLIVGPLQGGVVDYGLGGERASGGIEIVVVLISIFWVSGQEMDSWSRRAVPWSWSRKTVAWKTGSELHLIHKATSDCGIQCDAHCVHSPIRRYGILCDGELIQLICHSLSKGLVFASYSVEKLEGDVLFI